MAIVVYLEFISIFRYDSTVNNGDKIRDSICVAIVFTLC